MMVGAANSPADRREPKQGTSLPGGWLRRDLLKDLRTDSAGVHRLVPVRRVQVVIIHQAMARILMPAAEPTALPAEMALAAEQDPPLGRARANQRVKAGEAASAVRCRACRKGHLLRLEPWAQLVGPVVAPVPLPGNGEAIGRVSPREIDRFR